MHKRKYLIILVVIFFIIIGSYICVQYILNSIPRNDSQAPRTFAWFYKNSDVISYVEILAVDVNVVPSDKLAPPGSWVLHPKQAVKVKLLKVLKGSKQNGETLEVLKPSSYFYFTPGQKLVVYLKRHGKSYQALVDSGEWRLAFVMAELNILKGKANGGIVASAIEDGSDVPRTIYVLSGRQKAPMIFNSQQWNDAFITQGQIDQSNVAEIPLDPGSYTILLGKTVEIPLDSDLLGQAVALYPFNRLVDEYYPYITLDKYRPWRPIVFSQ